MAIRTLIADDFPPVRSTVAQVLRGSGEDWEVCWEAQDGQAAVDKAVEAKPDLVILDFIMPARDGISAGREIRALFPRTPIILFTLHASPALEIQAKSNGFDAVVGKTEGATLIEAIRRVLQSRAGVRASGEQPAARIFSNAQPGTVGLPAEQAGRLSRPGRIGKRLGQPRSDS